MLEELIERIFYLLTGGVVGFWFGYMGCKIFSHQNKNTNRTNVSSRKTEGTGSGDVNSYNIGKEKSK